jgi:hypothetical protein
MVSIKVETVSRDADEIQSFMTTTRSLIDLLISISKLFFENKAESATEFSIDGLSEDDYYIFMLDELIGTSNFDDMKNIVNNGEYGHGVYNTMIEAGYWGVTEFFTSLGAYCESETLDKVQRDHFKLQTDLLLGNLVYPFFRILEFDKLLNCVKVNEEYQLDQNLKVWAHSEDELIKYANHLLALSRIYIPNMSASEAYTLDWHKMLDKCPDELRNTLIDYNSCVYSTEMVAVSQGTLTIDNDYIQTLQSRQDNDNALCNKYEDIFRKFLSLIPPQYAASITLYESGITLEIMARILNGEKFNADTVQELKNNSEQPETISRTHVFGD